MASEIQIKIRPLIEAQAVGSLLAGIDPNNPVYTGGTTTVIGPTTAIGAGYLQLELTVTVKPAVPAMAEVWFRGSVNGIDYTNWKYSHSIGESIALTGKYDAGLFFLTYQYIELKIRALGYDFTAGLNAVPILQEIQ